MMPRELKQVILDLLLKNEITLQEAFALDACLLHSRFILRGDNGKDDVTWFVDMFGEDTASTIMWDYKPL